MGNMWWITECTVAERGTSKRHAVQYKIACPAGRVFSGSQDNARTFDKPSAVAFVRQVLAAGDEVKTYHVVDGKEYSEPVRVREGKAAANGVKPAWLQTISDGVWNDNLYSLPDVE